MVYGCHPTVYTYRLYTRKVCSCAQECWCGKITVVSSCRLVMLRHSPFTQHPPLTRSSTKTNRCAQPNFYFIFMVQHNSTDKQIAEGALHIKSLQFGPWLNACTRTCGPHVCVFGCVRARVFAFLAVLNMAELNRTARCSSKGDQLQTWP